MYKGDFLIWPNSKLLIDNKNVTHAGLPIGDGTKIEKRQILKPDYLFVDTITPDWKKIDNPIQPSNRYFVLAQIKGNVPDENILLEDILD